MAIIALLADIHSNLPALEACLEHAGDLSVDSYAFLGDYVGYGAQPAEVLDLVIPLVQAGAPAVRGNHDDMAADFDRLMNPMAAAAANWTRAGLSRPHRIFLDGLPYTAKIQGLDNVLLVHGGADKPELWHYVTNPTRARLSLAACSEQIVICGHVHRPAVYGQVGSVIGSHTPVDSIAIPLMASRRWQVVMGSVGQPRDGNPAASYCTFDTVRQEITFHRVPYDVTKAAQAIRDAGLHFGLADRLLVGR